MLGLILYIGTCVSQIDECYPLDQFYCLEELESNYEIYGYLMGDYCVRISNLVQEVETTFIRKDRKIRKLKSKIRKLRKEQNGRS